MQNTKLESISKKQQELEKTTSETSEKDYQNITKKSLSSYIDTNQKFKELIIKDKETLEECQEENIDIQIIAEKLNNIHKLMNEEVSKANDAISKLSEQVKTLVKTSNIDVLTKVFNRRALISYLDKICNNNKIHYELHFLVLQINDFKEINQKHSHTVGDRILIYIANILKKTFRDGDKIFRYDEGDFIIILNRINDDKCKLVVIRLLKLIKNSKLIYRGKQIPMSVNIGTTKYIQKETKEILLSRAFNALYKAKCSGKNKIYSEI